MHSSTMRTARLLTVSGGCCIEGGSAQHQGGAASGGQTPPCEQNDTQATSEWVDLRAMALQRDGLHDLRTY